MALWCRWAFSMWQTRLASMRQGPTCRRWYWYWYWNQRCQNIVVAFPLPATAWSLTSGQPTNVASFVSTAFSVLIQCLLALIIFCKEDVWNVKCHPSGPTHAPGHQTDAWSPRKGNRSSGVVIVVVVVVIVVVVYFLWHESRWMATRSSTELLPQPISSCFQFYPVVVPPFKGGHCWTHNSHLNTSIFSLVVTKWKYDFKNSRSSNLSQVMIPDNYSILQQKYI